MNLLLHSSETTCCAFIIFKYKYYLWRYSPFLWSKHNKIMRDVNNGWLIRYLHSNTASAFFFLVYLHVGRGLYYGSYKAPRTLVWTIGTVILVLMMAMKMWPNWIFTFIMLGFILSLLKD